MSLLSLSKGVVFAGRYQIVRCIAQGGMGAVYEVLHIETDRRRALKIMLPGFLQSDDMRARFRQEARVTARIASEYIVDVLDAGIDEVTRMPFLVMELLEGEELDQRIKRLGPLDPQDVVTYLHQASLALDKTHRASIIHRDLKPGNLFLTERDDGSFRVKLLDFGIAKLVAEGATGPATQLLGTPLYMAPEQFQLGVRIGPGVDIFALGMIAFTLLTGNPYWYDEAVLAASPHALYVVIMQGPKEPACARALRRKVELPVAFDAWFTWMTAFDPNDRFSTPSSAIAALGEVFGILVAQRTSTITGSEPKSPSIPSSSPPSPLGLTQGAPPHRPERVSDALSASPAVLMATEPLPAMRVERAPSHAEAHTDAARLSEPLRSGEQKERPSAPSVSTRVLGTPRAERALQASSPLTEVAAGSTTVAGSHTAPAKTQVRGSGAAMAVSVAALLSFAVIGGGAWLLRSKAGAPESSIEAASEGSSEPEVSVVVAASADRPRSSDAARSDPTPSSTANTTPRVEPSAAPAAPTSMAAFAGTSSPQPTTRPVPVKKPSATTKKPAAPPQKPAIQFD